MALFLARDPVDRLADERDDVERGEVGRDEPDRDGAERGEVGRDEPEVGRDEPDRDEAERDEPDAEREPAARDPLERDVVERLVVREPLLRVEPEPERVLRDERDDDAFDCVTAARTLSKSLSACLLVFAASRRSALSAALTSL